MYPQLVATLVGGGLTLIGGFAGTLFWRWRDGRQEDRKSTRHLVGAINLVLAELAANHTVLERAVDHSQTGGRLHVLDHAYRQVELELAERLPATVGQRLFDAYAPMRAGDLYRERYAMTVWGAEREPLSVQIDLAECGRLLPVLQLAGAELRRVRDGLGASVHAESSQRANAPNLRGVQGAMMTAAHAGSIGSRRCEPIRALLPRVVAVRPRANLETRWNVLTFALACGAITAGERAELAACAAGALELDPIGHRQIALPGLIVLVRTCRRMALGSL
jgi:hypothetical protein